MKVYRANNGKKKISAVAICLLLTVVMAIGGTLAYLFTNTAPVTNTFKPAQAPNEIKETMTNNVKSNVYVQVPQNEKNVDVYLRVAVVVSWQDKDGNIGPKVPVKDTDYEVDMGDSKWVLHNGYYYYTDIVSPNESTEHLFDSITVVDGATPKGYALSVELLSQSIQAEGTNAKGEKPVQLAWGVTITEPTADNPAGSVTAYTPQP